MGLGIITKGVGFLPLLMFIPILILATKNRPLFTDALKLRCLAGPLVMVLVAAAWLIPMVLYVDHVGTDAALAYRDNILFRQTGERYANAWGHIQPWYYFLTDVIPGLWFPLPLLVLATWRSFIRSLKEQPAMFTLFAWVVLVVVFFSISPGKRGVYVLPALPMFALFVAALMDRAQNEHGHRPIARWFGPLITTLHAVAAMALILTGLMAWWDHPLLTEKVAGYTRDPALLHQAGSVVLAMGMVWLATLVGFWRSPPIHRWFVALMVGWMLFSTWGYTVLEPLRTPRNVLAEAEKILPPDAELGLIHFSEQFILFSKLDVTHFSYLTSNQEQERNAWRWMKEGEERYLLVEDDLQLACFDFKGSKPLGIAHREHWVILGPNQQKPACEAPLNHLQFFTPKPCREDTGLCRQGPS
jgi:4-amino-4-deoxy-L-arabinose transferase-like glycosyltransferase